MSQGHDGEIQGRGHTVMTGSWPLPEVTAPFIVDGWCACGDMARADKGGFYCIVDANTELIIGGGSNGYPREVGEVIYDHPAVAEAAVIGVTGDLLSEVGGAAVVGKRGATATALQTSGLVKKRIAADKYQRQVWCVGQLPKGTTGRMLRRKVRAPRTETASS